MVNRSEIPEAIREVLKNRNFSEAHALADILEFSFCMNNKEMENLVEEIGEDVKVWKLLMRGR